MESSTATATTQTINENVSDEIIKLNKLVYQLSEASNKSFTSRGSNSAILCRICYSGDKKEPLIHPCNCAGTMGLIHKTCLETWFRTSNSNECEICHFKYTVQCEKRTFYEWIKSYKTPSVRDDLNDLIRDFICFIILTVAECITIGLIVFTVIQYKLWETAWEIIGIVFSTFFLIFFYIFWIVTTVKWNLKTFRKWQNYNRIITLDLTSNNHLIRRGVTETDRDSSSLDSQSVLNQTQMQLNDLSSSTISSNTHNQSTDTATAATQQNTSINILFNFNHNNENATTIYASKTSSSSSTKTEITTNKRNRQSSSPKYDAVTQSQPGKKSNNPKQILFDNYAFNLNP